MMRVNRMFFIFYSKKRSTQSLMTGRSRNEKVVRHFRLLLSLIVLLPCFVISITFGDDAGTIKKCSDLISEVAKKDCEVFVGKNPEKYKFRQLKKDEVIKADKLENGTIYLIPPGRFTVDETINISNVENVAFIGKSNGSGAIPHIHHTQYSFIFVFSQCKHCMLSNVKINPAFIDEGKQVSVSTLNVFGEKTKLLLRNITISNYATMTHATLGYVTVHQAELMDLFGIKIAYEPDEDSVAPIVLVSPILLSNCNEVRAENIEILNINPKYSSRNDGPGNVIYIGNPIKATFKNITMALHSDSPIDKDTNFIGVHFSDMERYNNNRVSIDIDGLHVGEFSASEEDKHKIITPPEWPAKWHSLSLGKDIKEGSSHDTTKVRGLISIKDTDAPDITSQLKKAIDIVGNHLFPNLKVLYDLPPVTPPTDTKFIHPSNTSKTNSTHYNATSSLSKQVMKADSGLPAWAMPVIIGIGVGVFVAGYIGLAKKYPRLRPSLDRFRGFLGRNGIREQSSQYQSFADGSKENIVNLGSLEQNDHP